VSAHAVVIDGNAVALRLEQLESSIREHLVSRAMQRFAVRREELARARVLFATDMRLSTEAELRLWLVKRGMDEAQLEQELVRIIAFGKLKEEVAGSQIEPYFEAHREQFDSAVVARILVRDLAAGVRVKAELDAGASFEETALRESTDPKTRLLGGWMGRVRRRDLSPEEASFVFSTAVPSISEPIAARHGAAILKVERVFRAQLDQPTRAEIHEQLFAAWLEGERARSSVELKSFEVFE
jgi:parvulin-like peptidyl-prolyl isomerase